MIGADGLVDFLLARIAEDEATARQALEPEAMRPWGDRSLPPLTAGEWPHEIQGYLGGPWGRHCARWGPERVLTECAGKRQLIDECSYQGPELRQTRSGAWEIPLIRRVNDNLMSENALRALALGYADHPDYHESWRKT